MQKPAAEWWTSYLNQKKPVKPLQPKIGDDTWGPVTPSYGKEPWTCPHPGCPVYPEPPLERCSLKDPIWISIPVGQHIHIPCPVHGEHILHGDNVRFEAKL